MKTNDIKDCFDSVILKNMIIFSLCSNNFKLKYMKDMIDFNKDCSLFEFIINLFLKEIKMVIIKKPYKNYINIEEDLYYVKGKINCKKSIKNYYNKLNCSYDELIIDNNINRIIKYILYYMLNSKEIDNNLKIRIKNIYLLFDTVSLKQITLKDIDLIKLNKDNRQYETILVISKYIIGSIRNDSNSLKEYIDIDSLIWWVYQEFIRNYYKYNKERLNIKYVISKKDSFNLIPLLNSNKSFLPNMRTDIELDMKDKYIIIDAKCYSNSLDEYYNKKMFHSSNLYQIKSYLDYYHHFKKFTFLKGILVYPYNHESNLNLDKQIFYDKYNDYVIELINIDFKKSWDEVCNSLDKLLDDDKIIEEISFIKSVNDKN